MSTCMKIMKLLVERKSGGADQRSIDAQIADHLHECGRCAAFWSELKGPAVYRSTGETGLSRSSADGEANDAGPRVLLVERVEQQNERYRMSNGQGIGTEVEGKFFTVFVDDKEFHVEESTITGGEIMDLAGIPREVGLIHVLEDGTQVQVGEDEVVELKPGRRFKKAPRFVRG